MPPSGGPTRTLKHHGHQTRGKLIKESWTHSSKNLEETGFTDLSRRVRSPTLLEYASENLVPGLSKKDEDVPMGCEGSPDYSKWVPSDYFGKMLEWLANVDLGKPPSDEEEAQG